MNIEEEKFRKFIAKESYNELINHYGVNGLWRFIEIELLLPLKSDLHKKNSVIKMSLEALSCVNE